MRILLVNKSDTERELYRIYLENIVGEVKFKEACDLEQAKNIVEQSGPFDVVLWKDNGDELPSTYFQQITKDSPSTIFIVFGKRLPDTIPGLDGFRSFNANNGYIPYPISPRDFCLTFLQIASPSRGSLERVPAFQKVRLVNFYRFNKVLCPVYLQLSDRKYVKVLHAHSIYQKSEIDSYRLKGVEYFYIANSDFEKFKVTFTEHRFLERVTGGKETLDQITATQIVLHDLVSRIGITPSAIEMAEKNIASISHYIEDNPQLSSLFLKQNSDSNYLFDHGHILAMICCHIFNRLNWDTSENIYKLCSAAVLHDLLLHNPKMNLIEGVSDQKLEYFSQADITLYLQHPEIMAKHLEKIDTIPSEVIEMVRFHHENGNSSGFYRLPASRMSKMVATFVLAHRYVHLLYKYEFNPTKFGHIVQLLKEEFSHQAFSSILSALERPKDKSTLRKAA